MMRNKLRNRSKKLTDEEVNPMDGIINIVDAMLVFACGLMLSVVIHWNVDLEGGRLSQVEKGDDVTQIEDVEDKIQEDASGGTMYEKMGTVYKDPDTGKLYLMEGQVEE